MYESSTVLTLVLLIALRNSNDGLSKPLVDCHLTRLCYYYHFGTTYVKVSPRQEGRRPSLRRGGQRPYIMASMRAIEGRSFAGQRGFTIMELVVAVAFVGVVIVSLTNLFTALRQINRAANNYTIATQVAQQLIETYRNTPYGNISTGTTDVTTSALGAYPSLLAPRSATVVIADVAGTNSQVRQVDVNISYKDRTGTKQVQMSTQIATKGLNR
jgi:Tfp pilus assembly protein PilV